MNLRTSQRETSFFPSFMVAPAVAILLLFASVDHSYAVGWQNYVPVTPQTGELFGMEIEIAGQRNLGNVLSVFDVTVTPSERDAIAAALSAKDLDSYLSPSTLETLPPPVKAALLEGVDLGGKIAIEEKSVLSARPEPSPKVIPNEPSRTASGLIVPSRIQNSGNSQILLLSPSQPGNAGASEKPKELILEPKARSEAAWNTVLERWKRLPGREALVDVNRLHRSVKAALIFNRVLSTKNLKVKADAPEKLKELFRRLNWTLEAGGSVEFRHHTPVSDPQAFHADRELFSDVAGIRKYIDDPTLPVPDDARFSYHWHASKHGSSLNALTPVEQRLRLIDMTLAGRGDSMLNSDSMFNHDGFRGPVLLLNDDHIESRQHAESPRLEFDRIRRWMNLPVDEAVAEAEKHLAARSSLLQTQLLKSISANVRSIDVQNEMMALVKADPAGAQAFVKNNRQALETSIARSVLSKIVTPGNVAVLTPLVSSRQTFDTHFENFFRNVLLSSDPAALVGLQNAALESGLSSDETKQLFKTRLEHFLSDPPMGERLNSTTFVTLIRTYTPSNVDEFAKKVIAQCDDRHCLNAIVSVYEKLAESPSVFSAKTQAAIRRDVFRSPAVKDMLARARLKDHIHHEEVEFLFNYGRASEGDVIASLLKEGRANGEDGPRALAKLISLDFPVSRELVLLADKSWSQRIFPNDWAAVETTLKARMDHAAPATLLKLRETQALLKETLESQRYTEILEAARAGKYVPSEDFRFFCSRIQREDADAIDTLLRKNRIFRDDIAVAVTKLVQFDVPISPAALQWVKTSWQQTSSTQRTAFHQALLSKIDDPVSTQHSQLREIAKSLKVPLIKLRAKNLVKSASAGCADWFRSIARSQNPKP